MDVNSGKYRKIGYFRYWVQFRQLYLNSHNPPRLVFFFDLAKNFKNKKILKFNSYLNNAATNFEIVFEIGDTTKIEPIS